MSIWIQPKGEGDFILVEIVNISAGGLLFRMEDPIEGGTPLEVRFELPQNNDLVEAHAVVRHCKETEDHYLVGLQFLEVKNYTVPVLMAYLEALFL
jgi:c-di-GMP-binding flagellar brake protein YcgR